MDMFCGSRTKSAWKHDSPDIDLTTLTESRKASISSRTCYVVLINSLSHGRCSCYFQLIIFKLISSIDTFTISCEIALGLYGLYGPLCLLSPERQLNLITHSLWNCPEVNATKPHWWWVKYWCSNGMVPSGNMPLPEPMLTQIYVTISRG